MLSKTQCLFSGLRGAWDGFVLLGWVSFRFVACRKFGEFSFQHGAVLLTVLFCGKFAGTGTGTGADRLGS